MLFTDDMKELLQLFEHHKVRHVLVGGFAVNYYGYVRTTQDIDILIYPSKENARNVMDALEAFGFGKEGIPEDFFTKKGSAIHIGVEPNRIDLLTCLQGISNDIIFSNMARINYDGVALNIISLSDLLECKKRSARPKDLADADELEKKNAALTAPLLNLTTRTSEAIQRLERAKRSNDSWSPLE